MLCEIHEYESDMHDKSPLVPVLLIFNDAIYIFEKKNAQFHERSFHVKITHQHVEFGFKMIFHPLSNDVDLSLQKMNKRFEQLLFSEIVLFCIST